jgi:hypothetical protein
MKWRNLNLARATHSQSMCEAVSVSIWHLPQIGPLIIPSLKRWPFKWHCPVEQACDLSGRDLLSFKNANVLLAKSLERKLSACLCPGIDCKYSHCSLHIWSQMTRPATPSGTTGRFRDSKWVQRAPFYQLVSSLIIFNPFMSQHPQQLNIIALSQYH